MQSEPYYTIKEAGKMLGVSSQSIRRICNSGLIPSIRRQRNGYRILNSKQMDLLRLLVSLRQFGFTKTEIKRYAKLYHQGNSTAAERLAILTTRRRQLWQEIAERQKAINFIERQEELERVRND